MQRCFNTPGTILHRKSLVQCCPRSSRKYWTGKHSVQCPFNTPLTLLHNKNLLLPKRFQASFFAYAKSCSMLPYLSWDNISQVTERTWYNIVQKTQDNNAQKNIQFNFVLILVEYYYTGKKNCPVLSERPQATIHKIRSCSMLP